MATKVTPRNLPTVLAKLTAYALNEEAEGQLVFCKDFNLFLNELAEQDAFGTEGQLDPRGDQRH